MGRGWPAAAQWVYTILIVNFAWVLFRADSLGAAGQYFAAMLGFGGGEDGQALLYLRENWTVLLAAALFCAPTARWLREKLTARREPVLLGVGCAGALLLMFVLAASYIVKGSYNPFIYFNF